MPEDRKQKQRKRKKKGGNPDFDMRAEAYRLFSVDLTQIPGLMMLVFMLFSELGRDMSRWPDASHFVSWLGLCPDNDISGRCAKSGSKPDYTSRPHSVALNSCHWNMPPKLTRRQQTVSMGSSSKDKH